ncbi:hypothetical protein NHH03_24410 [Stieleria sp. TO1_6]|uniref:hypothetical protein n=1 Tax=Stieleria tagensis TaxID=2956795 RepID=UPI00209B9B3D|nr:hypothetical protein [Stieleria tagensis]MCO8124903.1 hypothetical protein [Stieleria tagensis]
MSQNTSNSFTFIQTNHGVSFPLVGPKRTPQETLADSRHPSDSSSGTVCEPPLVASTAATQQD